MKNQNSIKHIYSEELDKISEQFFETMSKETDRAVAVISVIYLDNILEKLFRSIYMKSNKVSSLFKKNQLLQPFSNKIDIAYFSGLIPDAVYHDLKLICEIRNKFAHTIVECTNFTDEKIAEKIDNFAQLTPQVTELYPPKLKFILIVVHMGALLKCCIDLLSKTRPPSCVEFFKLNEFHFSEMILTPSEISDIIKQQDNRGENSK